MTSSSGWQTRAAIIAVAVATVLFVATVFERLTLPTVATVQPSVRANPPSRTNGALPVANDPSIARVRNGEAMAKFVEHAARRNAPLAVELANYANICWRSRSLTRESIQPFLNQSTSYLSEEELAQVLQSFDRLRKYLKEISENRDLCARYGDYLVTNRTDLLLDAALMGDERSRRCFMEAVTLFPIDDRRSASRYRDALYRFADMGLKHGDWSTVLSMRSAFLGLPWVGDGSAISVVEADPAMAYQYTKLVSLGNPGPDGMMPEQAMVEVAKQLPSATVIEGDVWANDIYRRYFSSSTLQKGENACQ